MLLVQPLASVTISIAVEAGGAQGIKTSRRSERRDFMDQIRGGKRTSQVCRLFFYKALTLTPIGYEWATILRLDSPVHRTQPRIAIGPYIVHAPGIPWNFLSNLRRIAYECSN